MPTELDKTIMHKAWMWDDEADEPVEVEVTAPTTGIHFADVQDLLRAKHAELTTEVGDSVETVAHLWTRRDRVAERITYEEDKAKALSPTNNLPVDPWEGWREDRDGDMELVVKGDLGVTLTIDAGELLIRRGGSVTYTLLGIYDSPELARDAANAVAQALGGWA